MGIEIGRNGGREESSGVEPVVNLVGEGWVVVVEVLEKVGGGRKR